jgi:hypothetical protein
LSGTFQGVNLLEFAVTEPIVQEMPPERNYGPFEVIDSGTGTLMLTARLSGSGTPCHLQASRQGSRVSVLPGQRCAAWVRYVGIPVAVMVQVDEGAGELTGHGLRVALRGPFLGEALVAGRAVPLRGIALWRFDGTR